MNDAKPGAVIEEALARGESALDEYDSKRFLSSLGIPVNRETLVHSAAEAAGEAEKMGFPVVLKACGASLHHKSDMGGVVLNVETGGPGSTCGGGPHGIHGGRRSRG